MDKKTTKIIAGILTVVIGILLIILKQQVISIALTVLGVALIVSAIIDLVHKNVVPFIVKLIIGIAIIVLGWALVEVALYILAVVLLIAGCIQIYENVKAKAKIWAYILPLVSLALGLCLIFIQNHTVGWIFILAGVGLIIEGVLMLVNLFTTKKRKK